MKKEYLIGLITGCLLTFSVLVFMGANENEKEVGRYQMALDGAGGVGMVDTKTGDFYWLNRLSKKWKNGGGFKK